MVRLALLFDRGLRYFKTPLATVLFRPESVPAVGGERADVDRRLGVGGEHHERLAGGERGQRPTGLERGERAEEPAGVEQLRHTLGEMMIAAILESGQPERLYTGLSLLVSAAAEGRPARGLVSFGALAPMLDDAPPGEDTFSRSLHELRATARELEDCRLWACAAAVELTGASAEAVEARLDGVMSTPRFLREVEGAQLVVV